MRGGPIEPSAVSSTSPSGQASTATLALRAHGMAKLFGEADVIHCYSRGDAIAGGILIDVTETARESGCTVPVA